jgi:hypothetical protein
MVFVPTLRWIGSKNKSRKMGSDGGQRTLKKKLFASRAKTNTYIIGAAQASQAAVNGRPAGVVAGTLKFVT